MSGFRMSMLLPFLSVLAVAVWGGGLGTIFIVLNETGLGQWGAIWIGLGLVVGVPSIAGFLAMPRGGP